VYRVSGFELKRKGFRRDPAIGDGQPVSFPFRKIALTDRFFFYKVQPFEK